MSTKVILIALSLSCLTACKDQTPKQVTPESQAQDTDIPRRGNADAGAAESLEGRLADENFIPKSASLSCVRLTDDLIDCHLLANSRSVILPSNSRIDWHLAGENPQANLTFETADRGNSEKSWVISLPKDTDGEIQLVIRRDQSEFETSLSVAQVSQEPSL